MEAFFLFMGFLARLRLHAQSLSFGAIVFLVSQVAFASPAVFDVDTVRACDDNREWPPYTYYERDGLLRRSSTNVTGFSVDVITHILNLNQTKLKIELVPMAQCKGGLKEGKLYQIELNSPNSPQTTQDYLLSDSLYEATNVSFYFDTYHPHGFKINSLKDLKKYKICGLSNYDYSSYGLKENAPNLNLTSNNFQEVLEKLENKTCDLFIEKFEVAIGQQRIGKGFLDTPHLKWVKIPDKKDEAFRILIAKNWPHSYKLLEILNQGIKEMKENGEMKKYLGKYGL